MISDRLVHAPSGRIRLASRRCTTLQALDMAHLEEKLQEHQDKRVRLVITDGVFSMDGDLGRSINRRLPRRYTPSCSSPDSHASGFIGKTGRGVHEHFGVMGEDRHHHHDAGQGAGGASGGCVSGRKGNRGAVPAAGAAYLFSNAVPPPIARRPSRVLEDPSATTERRRQARGERDVLAQGSSTRGSSSGKARARLCR